MTREQAEALSDTGWWKDKSAKDIVMFQLFDDRLFMPFSDFHKAIEEALGRPVWTHEFAFREQLEREFLGDKPKPTMDEIAGLLGDKAVIVVTA